MLGMLNCKKESKKMDANTEVGMEVHFYSKHMFATPPLQVLQEDLPMSCEQICVQCAQHLSEHLGTFFTEDSERIIGPLLLPMFGLCTTDQKWIPEAHIFTRTTHQNKFYFRVKIRPQMIKDEEGDDERVVRDKSIMPDGIFMDYLFWQCAEDFLSGQVWNHFETDINISDVQTVNEIYLWIHIGSADYLKPQATFNRVLSTPLDKLTKMENIGKKVHFINTWRGRLKPKNMPKCIHDTYNTFDPLMSYVSTSHMRSFIQDFYKQWGKHPLTVIRRIFVSTFMTKHVPYYLLEVFHASMKENTGTVGQQEGETQHDVKRKLVIKPHIDGDIPGIYCSATRCIAALRKIIDVDVISVVVLERIETEGTEGMEEYCSRETGQYSVVLRFPNSLPKYLQMKDKETALSFLSVLEQYCRLKFDYYLSLNKELLAAPSLQVLNVLKSFGPMEERDAWYYLNQQMKEKQLYRQQAVYLIYQDTQQFNLLHAMVFMKNATSHTNHDISFDISHTGGQVVTLRVKVGTEERPFHDHMTLLSALDLDDYHQLTPGEKDICGAMHFLKETSLAENVYNQLYWDVERSRRQTTDPQELHPMLFRSDQVTVEKKDLIAHGMFASVYPLPQRIHGSEVVLKEMTKPFNPDVQEAYRIGTEKLLKLRECSHLFVLVMAIVITAPFRVVLKKVGTGVNLRMRLRDTKATPLIWIQLVSVWDQLADCLSYLKQFNLAYGSFSCDKILIQKEKDTSLTIRLGDPSQAIYLDTLPIADALNQERLPWIAPERVKNGQKLSEPTARSDVYEFANVIFETCCQNMDPSMLWPTLLPRGMKFAGLRAAGKTIQDLFLEKALEDTPVAVPRDAACCPQQQEGSPDLTQASNEADSSDSEQHSYSQVTVPASPQESGLASGDTQMTDLSAGHVYEDQPTVLQELRKLVKDLLKRCWDHDPQQRPEPRELMNYVSRVLKQAAKLLTASDCARHLLALQVAEGMIGQFDENKLGAVKSQLLRHEAQTHSIVNQGEQATDVRAELQSYEKELKEKVESNVEFLIPPRLIKPIPKIKKEEGQFGEVEIATLLKREESWGVQSRPEDRVTVAVKTVKDKSQYAQFLKEIFISLNLKHENIVLVLGVVLESNLKLVMEFADKRSLESHISQEKSEEPEYREKMLKYACDIAKAMEFLSMKRLIHGDLAARNVVIFSGGSSLPEYFTAKIIDFGFSHRLQKGQRGCYYYDLKQSRTQPKKFPTYWMAKEIIEDMINGQLVYMDFKSDVWSFGVTLWEMFTGSDPSRELSLPGLDMPELLKHLKMRYDKHQMLSQRNSPSGMYHIMQKCWAHSVKERPDFSQLTQELQLMKSSDL